MLDSFGVFSVYRRGIYSKRGLSDNESIAEILLLQPAY